MGLLKTGWEAKYEGHKLVVSRNEFSRGYKLQWDGEEVASRAVSLVGLGELEGTVDMDGRARAVKVELDIGSKCKITVDGKELDVKRVK